MDIDKNEAIKALLERRRKANTRSADIARKWLADEGLVNEDGELKPQFGGATKPEKDD